MPNGGSDCCGECWFNARNKGGPTSHFDPTAASCIIRHLAIANPFYTYCGNHPYRRPEPDHIPIGPVFISAGHGREIWKTSPDTEYIRQHLLMLLTQVKETSEREYASGMSLNEIVIWQLGEFQEPRAVPELARITAFDAKFAEDGPSGRTCQEFVKLAREALAKIAAGQPRSAQEQKDGTDIWALRDGAKTNAADFEKLKSRAASDEAAAQFALGTLYDPIFNFSKLAASDVNVALSWYRKSAAQGNIDAARVLGIHSRDGVGMPADCKVALQWFRKAADAGDAFSENEIGVAYGRGLDGLTADPAEAAKWYQKSAAHGSIVAARNLGYLYRDGIGVAADGKVALQWFRKAADAGDADAQNEVGVAYFKGIDGLTADPAEAAKWYQRSAAHGNILAARNLGYLYRNGIGVAADGKVALQWFRKAADGGDAIAENEVGVAYLKGIDGLTADPAEAAKWLQKSAAQGNVVAAQNLDVALKRLQKSQSDEPGDLSGRILH